MDKIIVKRNKIGTAIAVGIVSVFIVVLAVIFLNKKEVDVTQYEKILTNQESDAVSIDKILSENGHYALICNFLKNDKAETGVYLTDELGKVDLNNVDDMLILPGDIIENTYISFDGNKIAYMEYSLSDVCNWHVFDTSTQADVIIDSAKGDIRNKQNPRVYFYNDSIIYEKLDREEMVAKICAYDIESRLNKVIYSFSIDSEYISYGIDVADGYMVASVNNDGLSLLKYNLETDEIKTIDVQKKVDTIYSVKYAKENDSIIYYGAKKKREKIVLVDNDGHNKTVYRVSSKDTVNNDDIAYRDGKIYIDLVKWYDPISAWNYSLKAIDLDSKEKTSFDRVGDITLVDEGMILLYYPENTREWIDVYYVRDVK